MAGTAMATATLILILQLVGLGTQFLYIPTLGLFPYNVLGTREIVYLILELDILCSTPYAAPIFSGSLFYVYMES